MGLYDSVDAAWSWNGDYAVGDDGDLKDTSDDFLESFRNELHDVLRSESGDWELHPNRASNLSDFRGEINDRITGQALKERCQSRLVAAGLVTPEDLDIRIVPVARTQVLVILTINAVATPGNRLEVGQPLVVSLLYDSLEDIIFFIEKSKYEKEARDPIIS